MKTEGLALNSHPNQTAVGWEIINQLQDFTENCSISNILTLEIYCSPKSHRTVRCTYQLVNAKEIKLQWPHLLSHWGLIFGQSLLQTYFSETVFKIQNFKNFQENAFQNDLCKMTAILFLPHCVNFKGKSRQSTKTMELCLFYTNLLI